MSEDVVYNVSSSDLRLGVQIQWDSWNFGNSTVDQYYSIEVGRDNQIGDTNQYLTTEDWDEDFYSDGFSQERAGMLHSRFGAIKCIAKDQDLSVGMYEKSNLAQDISLSITSCVNGTTSEIVWKPFQDIWRNANHLKVVFFMKSKYFDFTDIANSIKYFMRTEGL